MNFIPEFQSIYRPQIHSIAVIYLFNNELMGQVWSRSTESGPDPTPGELDPQLSRFSAPDY